VQPQRLQRVRERSKRGWGKGQRCENPHPAVPI
jgi:hypothetical protein